MRFSEYFEAWIRAYYANIPLGRDFYTAVSASKFFGGAIAKYILQSLESSAIRLPLNIIDLGANNANLLNDIRAFLETLGVGVVENCNFIAVEANASAPSSQDLTTIQSQQSATSSLRGVANAEAIQKQNQMDCHDSAQRAESRNDDIKFYKNLAELKRANRLQNNHNIFIANEFFDALPCEIIDNDKIAFVENNRLIFKPCENKNDDKKVKEICEKFGIIKGEIPLSYTKFCAEIKSEKFIFIAFDYGDIAPRNDFSLRLFYKHKIQNFADIAFDLANRTTNLPNLIGDFANLTANLPNLTPLFGKCDITYNVPFFILDSAFEAIGAKKILSKRQDLALVEDFKILELLQDFHDSLCDSLDSANHNIYLHESNKIKLLLYNLSPQFYTLIYTNL